MGVVKVLEEDLRIGHGTAAGGVGGDGSDPLQGLWRGEAGGVLDQQEDAADLIAGGYGAAGNDDERGGESGDGDQTQVGGAGVKLGGADGRQGVVDIVVLPEAGGRGFVFKVVEQRSRIQKGDGRDA